MDNENLKQQEVVPQRVRTVSDVDLERMSMLSGFAQVETSNAQEYRNAFENVSREYRDFRSSVSKQILVQSQEIEKLKKEIAELKAKLGVEEKPPEAPQEEPVIDVEPSTNGRLGGKRRR